MWLVLNEGATAAADTKDKGRSTESSWNRCLADRICHDVYVSRRSCFLVTGAKII